MRLLFCTNWVRSRLLISVLTSEKRPYVQYSYPFNTTSKLVFVYASCTRFDNWYFVNFLAFLTLEVFIAIVTLTQILFRIRANVWRSNVRRSICLIFLFIWSIIAFLDTCIIPLPYTRIEDKHKIAARYWLQLASQDLIVCASLLMAISWYRISLSPSDFKVHNSSTHCSEV